MFTGIIDHSAIVHAIDESDSGSMQLQVRTQIQNPIIGESIAIDGVCLTVTKADDGLLWFDVSPETMAVTLLGDIIVGQAVHVERALRVGDRLGGHWVTGHVDGCLTVLSKKQIGEYIEFTLSGIPKECRHYCVHKGSIALAGMSLTINELTEDGVKVLCIPHTQAVTHCGEWAVGHRVHVEYDYLLKGIGRRHESI